MHSHTAGTERLSDGAAREDLNRRHGWLVRCWDAAERGPVTDTVRRQGVAFVGHQRSQTRLLDGIDRLLRDPEGALLVRISMSSLHST